MSQPKPMSTLREAQVRAARKKLQNPYAYLEQLPDLSEDDSSRARTADAVKRSLAARPISSAVRSLHKQLWRSRSTAPALEPLDVLDPILALHSIGYTCEFAASLGSYWDHGQRVEIAGTIDQQAKVVRLSQSFPLSVQRFTAAHELGHAVLHSSATGLHRDRPVDGTFRALDQVEAEANLFATEFLMPVKLVAQEFELRFLTDTFVLDEGTAFALLRLSLSNAQARLPDQRKLSRALADATQFNGRRFASIAETFRVSVEAMAIRLGELRLVGR